MGPLSSAYADSAGTRALISEPLYTRTRQMLMCSASLFSMPSDSPQLLGSDIPISWPVNPRCSWLERAGTEQKTVHGFVMDGADIAELVISPASNGFIVFRLFPFFATHPLSIENRDLVRCGWWPRD